MAKKHLSSADKIKAAQERAARLEDRLSPWVEATIKLVINLDQSANPSLPIHGRKPTTLQAWVMGSLAVHKAVGEYGGLWSVTHRLSGVRFSYTHTLEDAKKIAEVFNSKCVRALLCDNKEAVLDNMPTWVLDWLALCIKDRKYVELPPERV